MSSSNSAMEQVDGTASTYPIRWTASGKLHLHAVPSPLAFRTRHRWDEPASDDSGAAKKTVTSGGYFIVGASGNTSSVRSDEASKHALAEIMPIVPQLLEKTYVQSEPMNINLW
ncbi:Uncharacterized protein OBRU01_17865 [Operophtera brumata]|uniref:Uncharacterized protein n=1 Tax=Operophtera brumata TaxID=104452 RepID=A0A0L7KZZ1_OPEBR|nr:Uncharacterized protein OBRU01_17865 [Operophtera brumata]